MAARKSGDGSPLANAVEQRPGSYAKISGARRARKGQPRPPAASGSTPPSDADPPSALGVHDHPEAVDIAQVSNTSRSSPRPPRRAPGPLGMGEERIDDEGSQPEPVESQPRGARAGASRLKIIEINPGDDGFDLEDTQPPPRALPPADRAPRPEERRDSEAPSAPGTSTAIALADEASRPSLSSVLDARPSLRPSPPPPLPTSSPAWWLVVTLLCAVIAAAGIVALREALDSEPAPRAATTATSASAEQPASTTLPASGEEVAVSEPERAVDEAGELADAGAPVSSARTRALQPKSAPAKSRPAIAKERQEEAPRTPARSTPVRTVASPVEKAPAPRASEGSGSAADPGSPPAVETPQVTEREGPLPANPYADP